MLALLLGLIYLAFISLGLPDAVLGSAWPTMSVVLETPLSSLGIVTTIIATGTIVSSLHSDRMIKKLGTPIISISSVALTAVAMLGFSMSHSVLALCIWAIPYGLGAGSIDAALNNFVAVHFQSKHMSWLHCMWGVGATMGPVIMGATLVRGLGFHSGYRTLFFIQLALTLVLVSSIRLWKAVPSDHAHNDHATEAIPLRELVKEQGVLQGMLCFFCLSAIEQTAGLWASSYLVLHHGIGLELATSFGALFYMGIMVGRGLGGFITMKFTDTQMIRFGEVTIALGIAILMLPWGVMGAFIGISMVGFGTAPLFPCLIHSTPIHFGVAKSQAIVGAQMACAYTGVLVMPAIFGLIAKHSTIALYPLYLVALLVVMVVMYESLLEKVNKK